MPDYKVGLNVSYSPMVIIEAESLEDAEAKVENYYTPGELWLLSVEQGDEPWDSDIDIEEVEVFRGLNVGKVNGL